MLNLNKMKKITLLLLTAIAFVSCAAQNLENLKTSLPPNSIVITGVNSVNVISMQSLATQLLPFLNLQAGVQGPVGPQGVKGDKGDTGTNGSNGTVLPPLGNGQAWVMQNGIITAVDANFIIPIQQFTNQTGSLSLAPVTLIRGGNYEVSASTVGTGTGVVVVSYKYTDGVSGNIQTVTPQFNTMTVINAQPGSTITFSTTVSGSVNYSFNPFIYTR